MQNIILQVSTCRYTECELQVPMVFYNIISSVSVAHHVIQLDLVLPVGVLDAHVVLEPFTDDGDEEVDEDVLA